MARKDRNTKNCPEMQALLRSRLLGKRGKVFSLAPKAKEKVATQDLRISNAGIIFKHLQAMLQQQHCAFTAPPFRRRRWLQPARHSQGKTETSGMLAQSPKAA
jgi:hypothetical protein